MALYIGHPCVFTPRAGRNVAGLPMQSRLNLVQTHFLSVTQGCIRPVQAADLPWKIWLKKRSCQVSQNGEQTHHFADFVILSLFIN
jgi:hypothetical protein